MTIVSSAAFSTPFSLAAVARILFSICGFTKIYLQIRAKFIPQMNERRRFWLVPRCQRYFLNCILSKCLPSFCKSMASQYLRHRVAVVDGDKRVRDELEARINDSLEHECVATCSTAIEAVDRLSRIVPDMVLVDIDLPERSSIGCVDGLKRRKPAMQIIMLTPQEDPNLLYESLAAGASGYLLKSSSTSAIQDSLSEFQMFRSNMSAAVALSILKDFPASHGSDIAIGNLSRVERIILNRCARGHSFTDVAEKLGMPTDRIRVHLHIIYQKLQYQMNRKADSCSFYGNPFAPFVQPRSVYPIDGKHRQ